MQDLTSDLDVQTYVKELKTENSRLHKKIVKLEVENLSLCNRIKALEQECSKVETYEAPYNKLLKAIEDKDKASG